MILEKNIIKIKVNDKFEYDKFFLTKNKEGVSNHNSKVKFHFLNGNSCNGYFKEGIRMYKWCFKYNNNEYYL